MSTPTIEPTTPLLPGKDRVPSAAIACSALVSGAKLLCIDDTGWLIPKPGFEHLSPKKGSIYTLREYTRIGGVGAVSLMEWNPDDFYRACRFRPVSRPNDQETL